MGINDNDKGHVCGDDCNCGHDHSHDCACGHDHGEEQPTVTLTLEDDTEMECAILGTFDVDNNEYIALVPVDSDEALIYKFAEHENGKIELSSIEDDAEFQKASDAFYEVFAEEFDDDEEFEEIIEEE